MKISDDFCDGFKALECRDSRLITCDKDGHVRYTEWNGVSVGETLVGITRCFKLTMASSTSHQGQYPNRPYPGELTFDSLTRRPLEG